MEIFRTQIDRARVRYNAEAQPVKVVPRPLNYNRKPVSPLHDIEDDVSVKQ